MTPRTLQRIDGDVHVRWATDDTIAGRLPKSWRDRWFNGAGHTQAGLCIQSRYYHPFDSNAGSQVKTASMQGAVEPHALARDWLEPHRLDAAVISVYDAPNLSTFGDIEYPMVVARAVNDWMIEEWLDADNRLFGTIVVATQDPERAAVEIRRAAGHKRMVQVMLPTGAQFPYGHRRYHPIFAAAEECGLAVTIHAGTEGSGTSHAPAPCGWPGSLVEWRVTRATTFLGHLTSLITEGAFVQFPRLRIVGLETGVAWLSAYLWRFDKNYKGLRSECPWLKVLPSEYTRRYFRFGSQGVEAGEPAGEFWRLLRSNGLDKLLLYSSNFPRWDHESPDASFALSTCPDENRAAILAENALEAYPRMR